MRKSAARVAVRTAILSLAGILAVFPFQTARAAYVVSQLAVGADTEHRLFLDGFHFGSLIEKSDGGLIFRPHPDRSQVDGWGSSWYLNPYREDAAGAITGGTVDSTVAQASDIRIQASGQVRGAGGASFGTFTLDLLFTYDAGTEKVGTAGTLTVNLTQSPMAAGQDLNVGFIASNRLLNVPLLFHRATGNTGDMKQIDAHYAAIADPNDETWSPDTGPAIHFPQKFTNFMRLNIHGDLNDYDAIRGRNDCGIKRALKPGIDVTYSNAASILSYGASFNTSEAQLFERDNCGAIIQIHKTQSNDTGFTFTLQMCSQPPSDGLLPAHQPDAVLDAKGKAASGEDIYDPTGKCNELTIRGKKRKRRINLFLRVGSDGTAATDRIRLKGTKANRAYDIRYFQIGGGRRNVTAGVSKGKFVVPVASGAVKTVKISVRRTKQNKKKKGKKLVKVDLQSIGDGLQKDSGRAMAKFR